MRFTSSPIWSTYLWTLLSTSSTAFAFVPSVSQSNAATAFVTKSSMKTSLAMSEDAFDVVRVDLDDGRDYPIYIGAEFDADKG